MRPGNSKLAVAFEHYLNGSADKDEVVLIVKVLNEANLPLVGFRARAFKDAAMYIKMVDHLMDRQHQTIRYLQRSIDFIHHKVRRVKRMDL